MLIFFEIRTINPDGELVIRRFKEDSKRNALLSIYRYLYEGFYVANDQYIAGVTLQTPKTHPEGNWGGELEHWTFPNAPMFVNDLGGSTSLCIHEYGEASQITEGVFRL